MKIIFNSDGVAQGTALDEYQGPNSWAVAPEDIDPATLDQYVLVEGVAVRVPTSKVTRLAFRNRFTQPEKVMLEMAALDDPTAPMPARQQAAALRAYLADLAAATFIDLARADTRAGVQFLETASLLGEGRALQILDAPVLPEERHP